MYCTDDSLSGTISLSILQVNNLLLDRELVSRRLIGTGFYLTPTADCTASTVCEFRSGEEGQHRWWLSFISYKTAHNSARMTVLIRQIPSISNELNSVKSLFVCGVL